MGHSRSVAAGIFVLDIIAFGLAIAADARRNHGSVTSRSSTDASVTYCKYSKDAATGLGIAAAIFLLLGQTLVTAVTKCLCCSTPLAPGGRRALAVIFLVLSWVSFFIAETSLIGGASRAAYRTRFNNSGRIDNCETLRHGIFISATAFTLFTLVLSQFYYWCFCKASEKSSYTGGNNNNNAAYGGASPYSPYNSYNPGPFTQAPAYGVPYPTPPPGQTIGMATYAPRAS